MRARVDEAGPLSLACDAGCCFAGDERGERACDAWGVLAAERVCAEANAPAVSRCDEGRRCFGGEALWGELSCEADWRGGWLKEGATICEQASPGRKGGRNTEN